MAAWLPNLRRIRVGLLIAAMLLVQTLFILHQEFSTHSLDKYKGMTSNEYKKSQDGVLAHWRSTRATAYQSSPSQEGDSRSMPQSSRKNHTRRRGLEVRDPVPDRYTRRHAEQKDPEDDRHGGDEETGDGRGERGGEGGAGGGDPNDFEDMQGSERGGVSNTYSQFQRPASIVAISNKGSHSIPDFASPHSQDLDPSSQAQRLKLVKDTCRLHDPEIAGDVEKVYVYEAQKVAYCSTHKIASTYWIRLFRWLYNDTRKGHVDSPLQISKLDTHLLPLKRLKLRNVIMNPQDRTLVEDSYRFLFTREPFSRLWSVYIDKFLLPDNYFWSYFSSKIKVSVYGNRPTRPVKNKADGGGTIQIQPEASHKEETKITGQSSKPYQRRLFGSEPLNRPVVHMATENGREYNNKTGAIVKKPKHICANVTFKEFLQYIVNVARENTGKALDDHFRPVHYGCNPCKFQPHFIGKMETMRQDSEQILRRMKLENVSHNLNDSHHVEQEIDMLIDFNFELVMRRKLQRACVTDEDLEWRLIKAFIYNGYLPSESEQELRPLLPLGETKLKAAVTRLYQNSRRTSADIKKQRTKFKIEAYREIPKELLLSLHEIFLWDLKLFGYEMFPKEIFHP